MILDITQIASILSDNPAKNIVKKGQDYNALLRLHLYGDDMSKQMKKIEGYESDDLAKIRGKYSRSNKDLFSRLGRPIDKVFTSRGGSVYYNLSDAQDLRARAFSQDVRNGYSIRKWIEMFWKPHMLDDPFGLVFLEILPQQEAIIAQQQGKSVVYPTYKSINSIFDYLVSGNSLEYVVFTVSKEEKKAAGLEPDDIVYRVVDDAYDYYVKKNDEIVTILSSLSFPNYFGAVPAIINSDIVNPDQEYCFLSFYDDVIELANHFFLKGSIKITHDFLHGFPKYWEYADDCYDCGGTKMVQGEPCQTCKGTGKRLMLRVSDAKLLPYPSTKDDPVVTPNVAGYVSPDKTFYEIATADQHLLEDIMNFTLWGAQSRLRLQGLAVDVSNAQPKTATQIVDEIKPQADRLTVISEMAETRHKFILDNVIRINLSLFNYSGSSVNYGRRYMLESPDELWDKYANARTKGGSMGALDDLLIKYYEAEYSSDPVKLAIQLKLMRVEPFVHATVQQVDLMQNVSPDDKKAKTYFSEWISEMNDAMILNTDIAALRQSLNDYAAKKILPPPTPQLKVA